jgi:hypothetical protein
VKQINIVKTMLTHDFIIHEDKVLYKEYGSTCTDCYFGGKQSDKKDSFNLSRSLCEPYPCKARISDFSDPSWQSYYKILECETFRELL